MAVAGTSVDLKDVEQRVVAMLLLEGVKRARATKPPHYDWEPVVRGVEAVIGPEMNRRIPGPERWALFNRIYQAVYRTEEAPWARE